MTDATSFPFTGVAYVAKLEHEYMHNHKMTLCNTCFAFGWDKPMKRCNGCKLVDYCSKECQKTQWSNHKRFCNLVQGKGVKNVYLTGYERNEAKQVLVDTYRVRVETDHNARGEDHGIYYNKDNEDLPSGSVWVKGDVTEDFQHFLDLAESSGILPEWWSFEDRMECLTLAVDDQGNDESVLKSIDQSQLITRYGGDTTIRNAMCMLAELVVGYDGKGPSKDNKWYFGFQEYLDLHPEERARLIQGAVDAVKEAFKEQGLDAGALLDDEVQEDASS